MKTYKVTLRDDQCSVTREVNAKTLDEACQLTEDEAVEWVGDGEWGPEGAIVRVWYEIEGTDISDSIDVEVEPDEDALMREAGADSDCEHEWTSEGMGGCDQNPGVWSVGGTAMVFKTRCIHCGLIKTERSPGCQRNPGEHTTIEFEVEND